MPLIRSKENPAIIVDVLDYFNQDVRMYEPYVVQGTIGVFLKWNRILMVGAYGRPTYEMLDTSTHHFLHLYEIYNGTKLEKTIYPLPEPLRKHWMQYFKKAKVSEYRVCGMAHCPQIGKEELVNVFPLRLDHMDYLKEHEIKTCPHCAATSSRRLYRL